MKIYTRRSRVYRNLVLSLVWFGIVIYKLIEGFDLNNADLFFILAGISFGFLFYMELSRPYITISGGHFTKGIFVKKSIKLSDIEEWRNESGVLCLAGEKKEVRVLPGRISQKDMEAIYEVLRAKHSDEEVAFREEHGLN